MYREANANSPIIPFTSPKELSSRSLSLILLILVFVIVLAVLPLPPFR